MFCGEKDMAEPVSVPGRNKSLPATGFLTFYFEPL